MIQTKLGSSIRPSDIPSSCFSFETFHRFVAIISSRAMVLKGVKHLTPLAEMINYKSKETYLHEMDPKNDDERCDTKAKWIPTPFDLYHTLSDDNSITVRSDRDVFADVSSIDHFKADGNAVIHLYEDYGPVDSSLFLQAHGFVPDENPHHCAIVPKSLLLPNEKSGDSSHQKNARHLFQALKTLKLVYPGAEVFDGIEDVCVKQNLEITEDGSTVGRKRASDSIAIATLLLDDNAVALETEGDSFPSWSVLKQYCINAINSGDVERIEIRCARYPGSDKLVRRVLRKAARALIREDDSGIEMVIDSGNDSKMDQLRSQLLEAREHGKEQLAIALQFRIEERKILVSVANSREIPHDDNRLDQSMMHLRSNETELDESILEFKAFVETFGLPVNKIEPKVVGNGIRIGAFATEFLNVGDAYISLPPTAVIGVDTALAHASKTSPDLEFLLRQYSKQQRDGFNVLLLFLLHERFVLGKKSVWWPYLNLLPKVSDLRDFHPLFFSEQEIDKYLAGSDVRKCIYRYQQGASERHKAIASDIFAAQVLGGDVLFDKNKFYWACAILDGRSIWWEGERHIVPLLDLVNADGNGKVHETYLEALDSDPSQKVAVTRASRAVNPGEQVFENYAQPNYVLFTHHGFILEDNPDDCALLEGLFVHRNDPGAADVHRLRSLLRSTTPTFCIRAEESVLQLGHFLRAKYALPTNGMDGEVRQHMSNVLTERIARLTETLDIIASDDSTMARHQFMRRIVQRDLMHFQYALHHFVQGPQNDTTKG